MTTVSSPAEPETEPAEAPAATAKARRSLLPMKVRVPLGVCLLVAVCAQLPLLVNPSFYFTDDSSAQFLPMWHRLGERLLAGHWPLLLDTDAWMGGNLAGEALFGVWNPVNLANYVLVSWIGDLAVAAAVVKTEFLVIFALGVYLLCREYGARRGPASVLAVALPFSGFFLYFQAGTWAAGLLALSWVPHVWWSARKAARGRVNPLVPFVFGALGVTSGEPYGLLALCAVFAGLLIEFALKRGETGWRPPRKLALLGLCVGALAPLVFLPLIGTSAVSWRAGGLFNSTQFVLRLTDLLNAGMPSHLPYTEAFGKAPMTVPGAYLGWFVAVLLPWLDWSVLRTRWRTLAGVFAIGIGYGLLCIGPSHMWLWRWPIRHITMLYLAVAIIAAVLLSQGLRTDRFRKRLLLTGGILLGSGYLAFASRPDNSRETILAMVVLGLLAAALLYGLYRGVARWWTTAVLQAGTVLVLGMQLVLYPGNTDVTRYFFPSNVDHLRAEFLERDGMMVQIANTPSIDPATARDGTAWREMLFGNMYQVAGVTGTVAYTGIGHRMFAGAMCMDHLGGTCPDAYRKLWLPAEPGGPPMADALRAQTVVVQRKSIDDPVAPPGWQVTRRDNLVTVLHRTTPLPVHPGRLAWASPEVRVRADQPDGDRFEQVSYQRTAGTAGRLVFARLAWPGYQATVDGQRVPVSSTPSGLLAIDLPGDRQSGTLSLKWTPPGLPLGLVLASVGVAGALAMAFGGWRRSRR